MLATGPDEILGRLREMRPQVHHLTNLVAVEFQANVCLALGARPFMASAPEEVEEAVASSQALVVNLGTPSKERLSVIRKAIAVADSLAIPWVFDPVGVGLTSFRSRGAQEILEVSRPQVIKGNRAEMTSLAGRGEWDDPRSLCRSVAESHGVVAALTGAEDLVYGGKRGISVRGGTHLLDRITGTGCSAASIMGCLLAAGCPAFEAASWGLGFLSAAASAGKEPQILGPASLRVHLIDRLYQMSGAEMEKEVVFEPW